MWVFQSSISYVNELVFVLFSLSTCVKRQFPSNHDNYSDFRFFVSYHKIYYISLLFNFYFKAGTTYYDNDELYKVWTVLRVGARLVLARVAGTVEEDDITLLARNHHQSLVCHSFQLNCSSQYHFSWSHFLSSSWTRRFWCKPRAGSCTQINIVKYFHTHENIFSSDLSPQPMPQLMMPARLHLPFLPLTTSGPPLSPSQLSWPPASVPAHMKMFGIHSFWPEFLKIFAVKNCC